jgi:hypothetical protein
MLRTTGYISLVLLLCAAGLSGPVAAAEEKEQGPKARPGLLYSHVIALTSIDPPRWYGSPPSMEKAAVYTRDVFAANGGRIEVQEFEAEGEKYRNVIASYGPKDGPRFIVGAHYDVCYQQPGADDNASGVAGLLELARLLGEGPEPSVRVDLVAYALEEPPFFGTDQMGSAVHARSMKKDDITVIGMISLEMIGYFTDRKDSQRYPSILLKPFYPDRGNFIAVIGNFSSRKLKNTLKEHMSQVKGLEVSTLTAPSFMSSAGFSDHRNYWEQGYKAVMVSDTSFFRNPNYHEPTDTPDTLDYGQMALVVDGVYRSVLSLTGAGRDK